MIFLKQEAEAAIVLLHEIYGINKYIIEVSREFFNWGFDVGCPDLTGNGVCYPYSESGQAYANFLSAGGFDQYEKVNDWLRELRRDYAKIILIGFSAGATIAWRCAESGICDCMAGVYGSRIRDYTKIEPQCRSLLLFADQEQSFDVRKLAEDLRKKKNTLVKVMQGRHGFMDPYSQNYNNEASGEAMDLIRTFIQSS